MAPAHVAQPEVPEWIRWSALIWLGVWFPAYWYTWGAANFLHLCDIAVILTCIGLWTSSALIISSQAVASLLIDVVWVLDVGWRFITGHDLVGGVDYLFDPRYALWVRLLSLFHLIMLPLLVWALQRLGYDPRGVKLQVGIAFLLFISSRFSQPQENINFAFTDPFLHRQWGPAPVHLTISLLFVTIVIYLPTHLLLRRVMATPCPSGGNEEDSCI
jgi:hypothetical protein